MKKLMLTLLAAAGMVAANAQSHTILLYGNASVTTDQLQYDGGTKTTNVQWAVNPGVGYQFNPHWTIGLQGSYGQGRNPELVNGSTVTTLTNDWTAGVFLRYTKYFGPIFFMYGQLQGSYIGGTTETEDLNNQANYNGFNVNVFPGIGAFVCKGLALNFSFGGIGYQGMNWTNSHVALQNENKFVFNFGQQFNFGVSKNFGCGSGHHKMHGHHEPGDEMRHMNTDDDDDDAPKAKQAHHDKEKKHHKEKKEKKEKKHKDDDGDDD